VSPGTYGQIHFRGKTITIRSENPYDPSVVDSTIIRGESSKVATVTFDGGEGKETTLSGFTITGAGNGIDCPSSSPTLRDNAIVNCGKYGIQAFALSRDTIPMPHIHGNMISGNTLGGIYFRGAPVITGNTIENNKGINACLGEGWGPVVITGNTINGNEHEAVGASVPFSEGLGVLTDNTIIGNGGGVGFGGNVIITRNLLVQNRGPLLCYEGTCHDNVVVDGGGIWSYNALAIGNNVQGNGMYGIYLEGGSAVANVISQNLGYGVRSYFGSVIKNTIVNNGGAGVLGEKAGLVISGNLIVGNGGYDLGGGVYFNAYYYWLPEHSWIYEALIMGNTIVGNRSAEYGGGILCGRGSATIVDCILSQNRAENGAEIAMRVGAELPADLMVSHSAVRSGEGNVYDGNGEITLLPGNIDADPLFVDPGHWDDAGTPDDPSDDTFIPGDYHLLPGSPCIDGGTNDVDNPDTPEVETLPATDIAGLPRTIDGNLDGTATVDIGAYEFLPGDVNYDGRVNILDLITIRVSMGQDPASSPAARKADANADGRVNIEDLIFVRNRLGRNQ